ncbi:MAG: hypothetical protein JNK23_10740 [Opitutaceae bacterium]|nr:hypothetical protein [Opitutaceae bacterium]
MSLLLATLLTGLVLIALGLPLLLNSAGYAAILKAFPRSAAAANVVFPVAAVWFLYNIANLGAADLIIPKPYMFAAFALIAVLSMIYMREFLAVRGLAALVLVAAMPLLDSAYMKYELTQRLLMVTAVYAAIAVAIWLGAQPWRLRDWIAWVCAQPGRSRGVGGALTGYGLVLAVVAFTY